ncbi:hypothetical protein B0H66DRAFT_484221 [Apodospora peruviana]|uniref:Uncharacterized protein n=1 Tax=Apodospora peruviana TaxID=516989 RepID=A0AAE0M0B7_9PEZI|nr:hypothetical protein B0H66DRAFT_484221 [Apodospora peruviana]
MAAPQAGDIIKFAELAWKVFEYGWTREYNASNSPLRHKTSRAYVARTWILTDSTDRQYMEFGGDVRNLAESLEQLSSVIARANDAFRNHGLLPPANLGWAWDEETLREIIGDYEATLNECIRLLDDNRSYMATTGPTQNVVWNMFVQPNVEILRKRILFHSSKIQQVLRPFEIDLRLRIHSDLVQRIEGVGAEVRGMRRELQQLRRAFDPSLIQDHEKQYDLDGYTIDIPDETRRALEQAFDIDGYDYPPLRDICDAFIRSFDASTRLFQPDSERRDPPEEQYMALLTSQFLMAKMLESAEFREAPVYSHWPRYITTLSKQLSDECRRFARTMEPPIITDPKGVMALWVTEAPPAYVESVRLPVPMEFLLEMDLKTSSPNRWRRLKLFRYCDGTDRRFRLVIRTGEGSKPPSDRMPRPIDFDLSTASLIPRYASYEQPESLELVLKLSDEMYSLVFFTRPDLYKFQQALTGYEVVDRYMQYRLQVIFVLAPNQKVKEYASAQLWRPIRLDGEVVTNDFDMMDSLTDDTRRLSVATTNTRNTSRSPTNSNGGLFELPALVTSPLSPIPRSPGADPWNPQADPWSSAASSSSLSPRHQPQPRPRDSAVQFQIGQNSSTFPMAPVNGNGNTYAPRTMRSPSVASGSGSSSTSSSGTARPKPIGRKDTTRTMTTTANGSVFSSAASTASYTTRPISVSGATTLADTAVLHCKPTEPLLVLFTQNCETNLHNIIAVTLDKDTAANYRACQCMTNPQCRVGAIERGTGNGRFLNVLRLSGGNNSTAASNGKGPATAARWDLFPLAEPLRSQRGARTRRMSKAWRRVIRVSICLETPQLRQEFSGLPCNCVTNRKTVKEPELMACLTRGHRGRLGLVQEWYRREMKYWYQMQFGQREGGVILTSQAHQSIPGMGWG